LDRRDLRDALGNGGEQAQTPFFGLLSVRVSAVELFSSDKGHFGHSNLHLLVAPGKMLVPGPYGDHG
jgi:hypothetical protein